jgi:CRISPR-associated exonuclease Cas4
LSHHLQPDTIPISALNALVYCPRRFYYQFVQADMLVNEFVLEGVLLHRRVHQHGTQTIEEIPQTTRLYLYSETLHLSGFADIIEEYQGILIPVEYKHGKQGTWLNDAVQLCAQALCLEELQTDRQSKGGSMNGLNREEHLLETSSISHGYIYYAGSHRRERVNFTEELRNQTQAAIVQALLIASSEQVPPPLERSLAHRCPCCSLQPLCLPDEVRWLQSQQKGA